MSFEELGWFTLNAIVAGECARTHSTTRGEDGRNETTAKAKESVQIGSGEVRGWDSSSSADSGRLQQSGAKSSQWAPNLDATDSQGMHEGSGFQAPKEIEGLRVWHRSTPVVPSQLGRSLPPLAVKNKKNAALQSTPTPSNRITLNAIVAREQVGEYSPFKKKKAMKGESFARPTPRANHIINGAHPSAPTLRHFTITSSVTKHGTEYPKAQINDEAIREKRKVLEQIPQRQTAYERYIKYGKFPRKKNARKRLGRRLEKQRLAITPDILKKRIDQEA